MECRNGMSSAEAAAGGAEIALKEAEPCDLGKKSHWDTEFGRDLAIFRETGDPGYAWFEEQLGSRLVAFFDESDVLPTDAKTSPVLDVGCGNGQMLMDLHELGYTVLYGVDYCEAAIELCREFLVDKSEDDSVPSACFANLTVGNIAALPYADATFAMVHDKGTYDAWRLGDNVHEAYMDEVHRVMRPGGLFVLSCVNWTADEMISLFCTNSGGKFEHVTTLKGASFKYGGVTGHNVTTVVLRRL